MKTVMKTLLKKIPALLCAGLLAAGVAAEELAPLPVGDAAPYLYNHACFDAEKLAYHDDSLDITSELLRRYDTDIWVVRVTVKDGSQLRTATAAKKFPSKYCETVAKMATDNNAVLAINGDFFSYHSQGVVVRGGKVLRNSPHTGRDTLMITNNGDFSILHPTTKQSIAPYLEAIENPETHDAPDTVREAFCFGPWLVKDGVALDSLAEVKISCGARTKDIRMVIGQTGEHSYLIFATGGGKYLTESKGLTILEAADVARELGCITAYNLDGGSSATIWLCGSLVNKIGARGSKLRAVSDVIYFATLVPSVNVQAPVETAAP